MNHSLSKHNIPDKHQKVKSFPARIFPDIFALISHLEKFVPVYNEIRPHCSLKGLAPHEVLSGLRPDNTEHLKFVNLIGNGVRNIDKPVITCTECV